MGDGRASAGRRVLLAADHQDGKVAAYSGQVRVIRTGENEAEHVPPHRYRSWPAAEGVGDVFVDLVLVAREPVEDGAVARNGLGPGRGVRPGRRADGAT